MPGVSRVTTDSAGAPIIGNLAPTVFVNGQPIAVKGAEVTPHDTGPHASSVLEQASATVFACGLPVVREGDLASCGHPATGSTNVFAG